jgi:heme/copper-type cytochrome/quinol oxidase subunit 4
MGNQKSNDQIRQVVFGLIILIHLILGMVYVLHNIVTNHKNEIEIKK